MRPVRGYSSSNTFSDATHHEINVGEDLPLIILRSKPSKLSNIKHTKGKYHHTFDCSYCKPCICNPMIAFVLIILMLIIPASISIGGYYIIEGGIKKNDYADTFNIEGSCIVTNVSVVSVVRETRVHYKVNEDTNSTIFPCDIGTKFNEEYYGVHREYKKDQKRACYTNPSCDEIFTSTNNHHHTSNGWTNFGAFVVFFVANCCLGGICYKGREELGNAVGKCCNCNILLHCVDGVCCLCVEYTGYKEKKYEYYEYQWDKVMNDEDRFDYVMSNWMKKYGKYKYQKKNGISVDIESIIYDYLY